MSSARRTRVRKEGARLWKFDKYPTGTCLSTRLAVAKAGL